MASYTNSGSCFEETVTETFPSVQIASQSLESLTDQIHVDGQPRKLNESRRQELIDLSIKLEGLKDVIEKFQNCVQEVYSFNTVELRVPKGREQRDSAYDSASTSQANSTPDSSSNRFSRGTAQQLSKELRSSHKSSISNNSCTDDSTKKDKVPSFYVHTPPSSSMSLNADEPDSPTSDIPDTLLDKPEDVGNHETRLKESDNGINHLSKPPSEEDNTKQV